jgi:hypothetical protein
VRAAQFGSRAFEQRTVRQEIPAGEDHLDQSAVALAAGVAARADRAQLASVGHVQAVQ